MQELMILSFEVRRRYEQSINERAIQRRFLNDLYEPEAFTPRPTMLRPALRIVGRGMVAAGRLLMRLGGDAPATGKRTTMTTHNA